MHALSASEVEDLPAVGEDGRSQPWEMKKLLPKHKQMCSLLAQGIPRGTIAAIIDCTPEYVTMLSKQPMMRAYITEMCQAAGLQLDAMFVQSVEAIGDVLSNGNAKERIQAARLQMEATKRIGSGSGMPKEVTDSNDRLVRLAERLLYLQSGQTTIINSRRDSNGIYQADGISNAHAGAENQTGAGNLK